MEAFSRLAFSFFPRSTKTRLMQGTCVTTITDWGSAIRKSLITVDDGEIYYDGVISLTRMNSLAGGGELWSEVA